jgi:hypothetical protein
MSHDNGWQYSTEGDLDPDLTEEAGYSGWEPPARRWMPVAVRFGAVIVLVALVAGALIFSIR